VEALAALKARVPAEEGSEKSTAFHRKMKVNAV